jgi:aquaporin Z
MRQPANESKGEAISLENDQPFPWKIFLAELAGTALLLLIGLSLVISMFGADSPAAQFLPSLKLRQTVTGFFFGGTGALIALSPIGKASGAHINPAVTMAFWLFKKIDFKTVIIYVAGQLMGAIVGCLPLLAWGSMGRSIDFGATVPGAGYATSTVLAGEIATTFTMVSLLTLFLAFRNVRAYTPAIFPMLYAIMVPLEADISGISTNPARSFGPAIVSGQWEGWWIYLTGPLAGAFLASLACSMLAKRITQAKLYHFDSDEDALLRKKT